MIAWPRWKKHSVMATPSRPLARLNRLESICARSSSTGVSNDAISVYEELGRDNPDRLAGFLQSLDRAGFLNEPPDPADSSQLGVFVRAAWDGGLVGPRKPTEATSAKSD